MRFGVLGPIAVWDDDGASVPIPGAKVRALLAVLLIHRAEVVPADTITDALWGERPPAKVDAVLRSKVSQLRRVLRRAGGDAAELLRWESGGYCLRVPGTVVDAGHFADMLAEAQRTASPRTAVELLAVCESHWRGVPFAEFRDEPFATSAVAELTEQRLTARELRIQRRIEAGRAPAVVGELTTLAAEHPLRENLHALLMTALYQTGRQAEAIEVYQSLAQQLSEQLGTDPDPRTSHTYLAILRQEQPLYEPAAESPPPSPLPVPLSPLLARRHDLTHTVDLLRNGRLVTITGPGGVGKTRLALAAAHATAAGFPAGAVFVDLARARVGDRACVVQLLADALGVRDDLGSGTAADPDPAGLWFRLYSTLMTRRMLLLLDNCEQVVDTVAAVTGELLRGAPELQVLATSREPLRIPGERIAVLNPLSLPADNSIGYDDPWQFGAFELFARRIADAGAPPPESAADIAAALRICRRLDGLPLALELAAPRVRTLGPAEVDRRLDDRFGLLSTGPRTAPPRQQTLAAVIEWSWELASPAQQRTLRQLSCADSVTLPAAAALVDDPGDEIADVLSRLVEQSLLTVEQAPEGPRYRMLESVRSYARARLDESGTTAAVLRRHRGYFLGLVAELTPLLRTGRQGPALVQLRAESNEIRLALTRADGRLPAVLQLMWFWILTGRLTEAAGRLSTALPEAEPGTSMAYAAHCWTHTLRLRVADAAVGPADPPHTAAYLAAAEVPDAGPMYAEAALARWYLSFTRTTAGEPPGSGEPPADRWGAAAAAVEQALAACIAGRAESVHSAENGLNAFRELGDRWGMLQALDVLAAAAPPQHADELDRWALRIAEDLDLHSDISRVLSRQGRRMLLAGDPHGARTVFRRARVIAGEQCDGTVSTVAEGGLRAAEEVLSEQSAQRRMSVESENYLSILRRSDFHAIDPDRHISADVRRSAAAEPPLAVTDASVDSDRAPGR